MNFRSSFPRSRTFIHTDAGGEVFPQRGGHERLTDLVVLQKGENFIFCQKPHLKVFRGIKMPGSCLPDTFGKEAVSDIVCGAAVPRNCHDKRPFASFVSGLFGQFLPTGFRPLR